MIKYTSDPKLVKAAADRFSDLQAERHLMNATVSGSFSTSRLYHFVMGHPDEELGVALNHNLSLLRTYKTLLAQTAYFHIPQAIAASSEDYPERHCNGCTVRLQASRAETTQLYLIIEIKDQRSDMPHTLNLFLNEATCARVTLPKARNGIIQTIIDVQSDVARLLTNPKTEIYLR